MQKAKSLLKNKLLLFSLVNDFIEKNYSQKENLLSEFTWNGGKRRFTPQGFGQ